ncbi:MAG: hypothetical protein EBZ48_16535, partial [Proteobacteria bacterium]|nr:hypothetical protein [Pseudomonadota bacterium]
MLRISKMLEQRAWAFRHPLRQLGNLPFEIYDKLEEERSLPQRTRDKSSTKTPRWSSKVVTALINTTPDSCASLVKQVLKTSSAPLKVLHRPAPLVREVERTEVEVISDGEPPATTNVPTDISNVTVFPNPAYNSKAVYDISNTLITNVGSAANPGYNPNAIYDNSNNDATIFSTIPNIYVNNKADYSTNNQYLNQIVTVPNPYYNPNITSEFSNPVNNWLGSSVSHYELRLKLNR